jgi:G3E family GTPase
VLQSIMGHPALVQAFRLDGVIAMVDAVNGEATLDAHVEAVKQVAVADRIVVAKTDLVTEAQALERLRARLRKINPGAPLLDVSAAGVAGLLDCGLYDPKTKTADVRKWLGAEAEHAAHHHAGHGHDHDQDHEHRHDQRVRSFTLVHDRPVPYASIEMFLDLLRSAHGEKLLRMKGIIELAESPERPLVVHGVQKLLHPPARLPAWPDEVRGTRLVLITLDMPEDYVRRLFAAFTNQPQVDTADRAAMENNPLAIAGR